MLLISNASRLWDPERSVIPHISQRFLDPFVPLRELARSLVYLFSLLPVHLFVYLTVCLCAYLPIYPFTQLSTRLSTCMFFSFVACLHGHLPACMIAHTPASSLTCLRLCFPAWLQYAQLQQPRGIHPQHPQQPGAAAGTVSQA